MHVGHYISATGHLGVISLVLLGGLFQSSPEAVEVTGVSIITEQEYAQVAKVLNGPQVTTETATQISPAVPDAVPNMTVPADSEIARPAPSEAPVVEQDQTPDVADTLPPEPQDIEDIAPDLTQPSQDVADLQTPEADSAPQDAQRVSPTPVAQPDPDAAIDEALQEATKPDETAQQQQDPEEATAPEAATTEIVTEATETATAAPSRSLRPKSRPSRPDPVTQAEVTPSPSTDPESGVNAALAAALAETPSQPTGPPLSRGEEDALRVSVQACWVVDVGSQAANVTVTLGMSMDQGGKVVPGSLSLISAKGGDEPASKAAFEAARRAVLRCQKGGYPLPVEKYEHWRNIEMTFNPEKMRIK